MLAARCRRALRTTHVLSNSLRLCSTIGSDYVVRSPAPDIELPKEDLFSTIAAGFSKYGSRIAIADGLTGVEYSYSELDERICKFSSNLQERGFGKGDVMCIVSPNCPDYAVAFLGTLRCGGIVSTCNPAFTAQELAFQLKNSSAKMVITVPECLPHVQEAAQIAGVNKVIIIDSEEPQSSSNHLLISYQSMIRESVSIRDAVCTELDDVAVLPYSSGTTGFPKGVMLTNSSITSNIFQLIHPEFLEFNSNISTSIMSVLPFFHIYGMVVVLLSSLYNGSKQILLPKFEPEIFLDAIERHRINTAFLVPPLILFLAKHPLVEKYDLTSLNDIITGAAPLGGELVKEVVGRVKCDIIRQAYGLTEMSPVTHVMPRSLGTKYPSSIGNCLRSLRCKIVDPETNQALPAKEEGEVWVSGPNVMKGYLNNPEATRDSIVDGGWLKTGDVGEFSVSESEDKCRA